MQLRVHRIHPNLRGLHQPLSVSTNRVAGEPSGSNVDKVVPGFLSSTQTRGDRRRVPPTAKRGGLGWG